MKLSSFVQMHIFGPKTAPIEFTVVVKEVKLLAQIRVEGFLSPGHQDPAGLVSRSGLGGKSRGKSELDPKRVFNFLGYQYDLSQGVVRPTPNVVGDFTNEDKTLVNKTKLLSTSGNVSRRASDR